MGLANFLATRFDWKPASKLYEKQSVNGQVVLKMNKNDKQNQHEFVFLGNNIQKPVIIQVKEPQEACEPQPQDLAAS